MFSSNISGKSYKFFVSNNSNCSKFSNYFTNLSSLKITNSFLITLFFLFFVVITNFPCLMPFLNYQL